MKNNSYNNWKEKSKSSQTRDYDFNTISDETLETLYHPNNITRNISYINYS